MNDLNDFNGNDTEFLNFLNDPNNFPPFSEGLTELLKRNVQDITFHSNKEKTDYLYKKFSSIGSEIKKVTIANWFSGICRPDFSGSSRLSMYELCFALELPIEEVTWFFRQVYFDRSFNCHFVEEAVYYYCFLSHLPYADAKLFLEKIEAAPEQDSINETPLYTQEIVKKINSFSAPEELIDFLSKNKPSFQKWNATARKKIDQLLSSICGTDTDKKVINEIRNKGSVSEESIKNCGLIIRELYAYYGKNLPEYIKGKQITSTNFMLEISLTTYSGIKKTAAVPNIIKENFPSRSAFSNIIRNSNTLTSYNSIKKALVFLKFYEFWCQVKLNNSRSEYKPGDLYNIFVDETNDLLFQCGYENLDLHNPYDVVFLCASKAQNPLDFLRDFMDALEPEEEFL